MNKIDGRGYLTFAIGEEYLRMAYAQCLSLKAVMPDAKYAVVLDQDTHGLLGDHHAVFDHVIVSPVTYDHPMQYECLALALTPWKETIKLDADVYFPHSIDHWWTTLRLRDACFTTDVYDYKQDKINSRAHRRLFDDNCLPNIYTAFWYFRYTQTTVDLFNHARNITKDWKWHADTFLIGNTDPDIRTDEVFAIAAMMVGKEKVTIPGSLVPSFTHMKEHLMNLPSSVPWPDQLYTSGCPEIDVDFNIQTRPFHYYRKEWLTDERIRELEQFHGIGKCNGGAHQPVTVEPDIQTSI